MPQNKNKKETSALLIVIILVLPLCFAIKGINVIISGAGIPDNFIGCLAMGLAFYIQRKYLDKRVKTTEKTYNIKRLVCLTIVCNLILLGTVEELLGNGIMLWDGNVNGIIAIMLAYGMENSYFSKLKEKTNVLEMQQG